MVEDISSIDVYLKTGNRPGAAGSGEVHLGIGGREFRITNQIPGEGHSEHYILGDGHNIQFSDRNDPRRDYPLTTKDLERFPYVYLRYWDNLWNLESVTVTCNPGPSEINYQNLAGPDNNIWLGSNAGYRLYLHKT